MKGEKILGFIKVAGPSLGLGAFLQDKWHQRKNHKVDISLKELGVEHSQFDLTEKQFDLTKKQDIYQLNALENKIKFYQSHKSLVSEEQNREIQFGLSQTMKELFSSNQMTENESQLSGQCITEETTESLG